MTLRDAINRVLMEFPTARQQSPASHPLAQFIRHDLAETIRAEVGPTYKVEGSSGRGPWAETPWVAVFDEFITVSASAGYYVVYLFRSDGAAVYLVLGQATTEIQKLFGRRWLAELGSIAATFASHLPAASKTGLTTGDIDLGGGTTLTRGYERGSIVALKYTRGQVPSETDLVHDLGRFLDLYRELITVRDALALAGGTEEQSPGLGPGAEGAKYRWHLRIERNPRLSKAAKALHGTRCKVCSMEFSERYGDLGKGYIEAHHLVPLGELAGRPEPRILDPATDFTVVCANCHRMLHGQSPVLRPAELVARLV